MSDLIDRELLIEQIKEDSYGNEGSYGDMWRFMDTINKMPSAQPEDWMERNKERILQAGMEGREIEFRIGGRLFAIREKAQ